MSTLKVLWLDLVKQNENQRHGVKNKQQQPEGWGQGDNRERWGSSKSRSMYRGPMGMDNGLEIDYGSGRGGAGEGNGGKCGTTVMEQQ